jgi:DNA-binding NtrC family response regulator
MARVDDVPTAQEAAAPAPDGGRQALLVVIDGIVATHDLPAEGRLTLGRGYDCDVVIDHPSISRRHALLCLGSPSTLEDLGSVNGTRVRGAAIAPGLAVRLDPGEIADVGAALIVVQRRLRRGRSRRVWAHVHFHARVDEACARNQRFALLRIHAGASAPARAVESLLHEAIGPAGLLGYYAPGEYEALVDSPGARAVERITGALAGAGVEGARVGVASHPGDGRSADALLVAASRGAQPSSWSERPVLPAEGPMADIRRLLERVAPSAINVLILGETGAGKELVAETVHRLSPRRARPFVRLSCAALSDTLLESELFGHERGAFTGAAQAKPGLLETAEGGTLFLDEIGELPAATQSKLLRVLEERKVLRVGGLTPRPIDIRLVAATNRDLEAEARAGKFRRDLFFRLNGIAIVLPPLRRRVAEIAGLARGFIAQACEQWQRPYEPALGAEALALLQGHAWPGNIRELRNVMERAVLLCGPGPIEPRHLPLDKPAPAAAAAAPLEGGERAGDFQRIVDALRRSAGNQTAAAALLGISRRTLIHRLDAYQLPRPCKGRRGPS